MLDTTPSALRPSTCGIWRCDYTRYHSRELMLRCHSERVRFRQTRHSCSTIRVEVGRWHALVRIRIRAMTTMTLFSSIVGTNDVYPRMLTGVIRGTLEQDNPCEGNTCSEWNYASRSMSNELLLRCQSCLYVLTMASKEHGSHGMQPRHLAPSCLLDNILQYTNSALQFEPVCSPNTYHQLAQTALTQSYEYSSFTDAKFNSTTPPSLMASSNTTNATKSTKRKTRPRRPRPRPIKHETHGFPYMAHQQLDPKVFPTGENTITRDSVGDPLQWPNI